MTVSTTARSSDSLAILALFAGAVAIGFSPIFVRLSELEPTATAFFRVAIAFPVLWFMMQREASKAITPVRKPESFNDYLRLSLVGLFFAGDLIMWHWSIKYTTVANATLLANFAPIFVAFGAFVLFGERFNRTFLMGLVLSLAGAIILMGESLGLSGDRLFGDALGIITAMFYASYMLAVGRLRAEFSTATIMAWSCGVTALAILPVALIMGESLLPQTAFGWGVLAALALISHAGGQGAVTYALAHLPTAFSSVVLLFQPAIAAILAWMIFDEALSWTQGAGALVILMGVYLARRGSK